MRTPSPVLPLMTLPAPAAVPPMTLFRDDIGDVDAVAEVGQRAAAVGFDADVVPLDRVIPGDTAVDLDSVPIVAADDVASGGRGTADGDVGDGPGENQRGHSEAKWLPVAKKEAFGMASSPVTSVPMSLPWIVPPVVLTMVMALSKLPEIKLPAPAAVPPIWKPSQLSR